MKELPKNLDRCADTIGITGFVHKTEARVALGLQRAPSSNNPVEFLRNFICLRSKRQGSFPTRLGQVLHARKLYKIESGESLRFP